MKKTSSVFKNRWRRFPIVVYIALFTAGALLRSQWPEQWDSRYFSVFEGLVGSDMLAFLGAWHVVGVLVVLGLLMLIASTPPAAAIIFGLLGFVYTLFWGIWRVADMMTGVGINQSVLYHIFSGTEGADYSQFLREIIVFACFLVLATAVLLLSIRRVWKQRRTHPRPGSATESRQSLAAGTIASLVLGCLLVGSGWLVSPWHQNIIALTHSYSLLDRDQERRLDTLYDTGKRSVSRDKNLVVLYLESLESTYFDETLFPDLLPNLRGLRQQATYFSGIRQTPGAGWTIAGLVNTQCGLPLVTPGPGANDMGRVQYFLPKAKCLAEHLVDNGFDTVYLGGASAEFAGKGRFLQQHGFNTVRDKDYFKQWQAANTSRFPGWGAFDDELLESTYTEFVELSKRQRPFALFALTMDTHPPHGHTSPSCEGIQYGDGGINTLNVLHCSDRLISRFINRIRKSPYYQDTRLVVLSDHLSMVNDAKPLIDRADKRENLLMIFDTDVAPGERRVEGTMLDVGATLLGLMGADRTPLGFGRSLFESTSRAGRAYSADYYATGDVTHYLSFARRLWDLPTITGEIRRNGNDILLGENRLEAPFFSVLDERNKVVELYFFDFAKHIEKLGHGARYLYTRECLDTRNAADAYCLVSGLKGVSERVFSAAQLVNGVQVRDIF